MADSFVIDVDDIVNVVIGDTQPFVTVRVEQPTPFGYVTVLGPQGPPGPANLVINVEVLPAVDQDGVRTEYLLSTPTRTPNTVQVFRNGLAEVNGVGFIATTTRVTFTTAPLGSDVVVVRYEI